MIRDTVIERLFALAPLIMGLAWGIGFAFGGYAIDRRFDSTLGLVGLGVLLGASYGATIWVSVWAPFLGLPPAPAMSIPELRPFESTAAFAIKVASNEAVRISLAEFAPLTPDDVRRISADITQRGGWLHIPQRGRPGYERYRDVMHQRHWMLRESDAANARWLCTPIGLRVVRGLATTSPTRADARQ